MNVVLAPGYFSSNGSGFLIASNGLVVTNAHVVARCNRYSKIQVCNTHKNEGLTVCYV